MAREKGRHGRLGAKQLPGASSSQAEGSARTPACSAPSSRPSSRSSRGPKAHRSTYTSGQNTRSVSHSRFLCEACIRIPRHGSLQRSRSTMEESTGNVHRDHPGKFSTVKFGWDKAGTTGAPDRKETCSAPSRGFQTYGPEDTWKAACPKCVKTSACADCTTPGCSQTNRWCPWAVGPCGCSC